MNFSERGAGLWKKDLLDIKLLQLFDVLYVTRNVSHAAELLGQSQPTVSIWLGQLRKKLNDPLFVRTGAAMQPTPQADALVGPAREILESLRRLATWVPDFDPATASRRFKLCITDASHLTVLPRLMARLREEAPLVGLEALRIDGNTAAALASGEADLAMGYIPWLETGIYQQALFDQSWVCLVNARHARVGDAISLEQYQSEFHIGMATGTGHQLLDAALMTQDIVRKVLLELPVFSGIGAIVASTDLLATLPGHIGVTLAEQFGLKVIECPFPIKGFTVRQHWHARYHTDAGNRWLRKLIAELFSIPGRYPDIGEY